MNFISNDDALALNIRVWDEKRNQIVDPEQVMNGSTAPRPRYATRRARPPAAAGVGEGRGQVPVLIARLKLQNGPRLARAVLRQCRKCRVPVNTIATL